MTDRRETWRRTALVTGASRGIGRAIAIGLAARGVRIAVHCRSDVAAANRVRGELVGHGHVVCKADLSDPGAVAALWGEVSAVFRDIDLLVNNAGLYVDHPPLVTELDAWHAAWVSTMATNLYGPANLSLLAAHSMVARDLRDDGFGRGRIVNISSRGAFRGEPDAPAYGASKAGLNSLSQSLAKALASSAVYVYCLAPGFVETDMAAALLAGPSGKDIVAQHPLGRVSLPEEVAAAAVFCALDAPAAMTGSIIDVNGASYLRT